MKRFAIDSVDAVQAAELQMPGALGARDGHFGWASVKISNVRFLRKNVRFLRKGVNEVTVWTQNPPEYGEAGRDKYLVVMVDYSGPSEHSFNRIGNEWRNVDLNGERKGALRGEWVIRIALHRHNAQQRKAITALGPARYRKAVVDKEDFVWGFTDALHRVFPDRPYTGNLGNAWTLDRRARIADTIEELIRKH